MEFDPRTNAMASDDNQPDAQQPATSLSPVEVEGQPFDLEAAILEFGAFRHARRLISAEGYFRALADTLRA